jgi:hypothetical protein
VIRADGAPRRGLGTPPGQLATSAALPGGNQAADGPSLAHGTGRPRERSAERDTAGLLYVAEMYGLQLDQLAAVLGVTSRRASDIAARWVARGQVQTDRLGPGPRWIWLTKAGLAECGRPYAPNPPALSRLAHTRAVVAVRLALEAVPAYAGAGAYWRSERRLRARLGGRLGARDHLPDAEVHWPELVPGALPDGDLPDGDPGGGDLPGGVSWAGECWAIEAELTAKTVSRTTAIMRELLTRTGDYGCPAADIRVPGRPPRHARVIYLCSPPAARTVARARESLGDDGTRIEIRGLPPAGYLPGAAGRRPQR